VAEPTESQKSVEHPRRRRDPRSPQPAAALSRRQLRGREQAEVAAEAQHRAIEAPASPALSRRERREREFEERYAERPPVAATVPDAASVPAESAGPEAAGPEPAVAVEPVVEDVRPESAIASAQASRRGRRARTAAPATVEDAPSAEPSVASDVDERMLAVANVETVPLEIELVAQHPVVEIETSERIAAETVLSAEVDFAEPHAAPEPMSALATSGDSAEPQPVPIASPRVRRSVPVAELLSSSSGTFVSHARLQPIKRRVLAGFVMMIAALFVVSLSIPSLGFASTSDFAAVQNPTDVTDSQNMSVGEGPALNAVRDDFYAVGAPGSLYSTTNTYVSKESQKLAQELMVAVAAGKLKGSVPDHIPEIKALADGVVKPDCGIDLRILQVMVIAVRSFDSVAVSDINRKCTGQIEGGGTSSSHYINGGGHAVDFYLINGASVPGADASTVKFAEILDPIMPKGSNLGQSGCRTSAGIALNLQNFKEFSDSCTHMHIDVGSATEGLDVNLDSDFK
jgi:hypothetical protein